MDFTRVKHALEDRGFQVSCFDDRVSAAAYLNQQIDGTTVGLGGSVTLDEMGLYESLGTHNKVYWHWRPSEGEETSLRKRANEAAVYLCSVNGLAETGEIVNIDGTGNRIASMFFGHRKVYFIVGENKIAPDYEQALWRARNIASPRNAMRLAIRTPCAAKGDRCYDCRSPQRICRGLAVLWENMLGMEAEVVLVHESLGY